MKNRSREVSEYFTIITISRHFLLFSTELYTTLVIMGKELMTVSFSSLSLLFTFTVKTAGASIARLRSLKCPLLFCFLVCLLLQLGLFS